MKQPCRNCPFRSDRIFPISRNRRRGIADAILKDADFACHKTTSTAYDYEFTKRCTGAAIFLEKVRSGGLLSNLMFRLAVMNGEIEIDKLDMDVPVCNSYEEFVNAVKVERHDYEDFIGVEVDESED